MIVCSQIQVSATNLKGRREAASKLPQCSLVKGDPSPLPMPCEICLRISSPQAYPFSNICCNSNSFPPIVASRLAWWLFSIWHATDLPYPAQNFKRKQSRLHPLLDSSSQRKYIIWTYFLPWVSSTFICLVDRFHLFPVGAVSNSQALGTCLTRKDVWNPDGFPHSPTPIRPLPISAAASANAHVTADIAHLTSIMIDKSHPRVSVHTVSSLWYLTISYFRTLFEISLCRCARLWTTPASSVKVVRGPKSAHGTQAGTGGPKLNKWVREVSCG